MWALAFDTFGEPDVLAYREMPDPKPEPGHVVLDMKVIGLNFADIHRRRGNYVLAGAAPHIAGYEGAGIVSEIGKGVAGIEIGDRIGFADVPFANATKVVVPIDKAIPLPSDIGFTEAAALLLQGLTAQYLTQDSRIVRPGDWVLVQAAGGGVGQHLIGLCTARGARVIAMASTPRKREIAIAAGASHAIGYEDDWVSVVRNLSGGGVDIAYDSVGTTLLQSLDALRPRGTVVSFGTAGGEVPHIDPRRLMESSKSLVGADLWNFLVDRQSRLDRASRLFEALRNGHIRLPRIETFALADGKSAHRRLEEREFSGKIVLTVD